MATSNFNRFPFPLINVDTLPFPLANADTTTSPAWWMQQWMETVNTTTRLQLVWLNMLGSAMQQEAEFFKIMAVSTEKLAHGAMNQDLLRDPSAMVAHYQEVADDITQATMNRMNKVTELSQDFRECLWDEIG
ncbi:hypothetical protein ACPF7Z_03830 [Halomonas sp. GXIMD04776]|uniref:hypothetical protein n=1 Tax=Halomonas sp. GXIMD04776 TaxID=3415605 RepID=UPI003CC1831D